MAANPGPMYIRLNRNPYDNVTPEGAEFVPGEPVVLKEGSDVARCREHRSLRGSL